LTYAPVDAVSFYASWSRSFLPQNFGLLRGGGLPTALRGESFEAGTKMSLLSGRIRPSIALFDIERTGAAVSDPDDFAFVVQLGRSRTRGIEIDVPAAITPRWRLIATYTYLDAKVTADSSIPVGTRLINAPDHSASLWTTWDVPGALDGVSVGAGAVYIGERAGNNFGSIVLPGYTRYDASIAYNFTIGDSAWRAQLNAINLTDRFFYESGGPFLPVYPAAPRTIAASLTYRFGAQP
jgi:iron complex outermembrane receptor protein